MRAGVTMIELLIVVSVISILTGIGVASLPRDRIAVDRMSSIVAQQFTQARLDAIRRNGFVGVCPTSAGINLVLGVDRSVTCTSGTTVATNEFGGDFARVRLGSSTLTQFFYDPRGVPVSNAGGSIRLETSDGAYGKTIHVNLAGGVEIQ